MRFSEVAIRIATTTSVVNSGLSDQLEEKFADYPWSPNQYVVMPVNPDACGLTPSNINLQGAMDFVNWMHSSSGANNARNTVNNYGLSQNNVNPGFSWNCEALPGDRCLLRFLPKIYENQIYNDLGPSI